MLPLNDRVIRDGAVQLGLTHQRGAGRGCGGGDDDEHFAAPVLGA